MESYAKSPPIKTHNQWDSYVLFKNNSESFHRQSGMFTHRHVSSVLVHNCSSISNTISSRSQAVLVFNALESHSMANQRQKPCNSLWYSKVFDQDRFQLSRSTRSWTSHWNLIREGSFNQYRTQIPPNCHRGYRLLKDGLWSAKSSDFPSWTEVVLQVRINSFFLSEFCLSLCAVQDSPYQIPFLHECDPIHLRAFVLQAFNVCVCAHLSEWSTVKPIIMNKLLICALVLCLVVSLFVDDRWGGTCDFWMYILWNYSASQVTTRAVVINHIYCTLLLALSCRGIWSPLIQLLGQRILNGFHALRLLVLFHSFRRRLIRKEFCLSARNYSLLNVCPLSVV